MARLRTIGIWMTLLLFVSGFASPFVPAVRAACPMQQKQEQMAHCAEAKPAPAVPLCCQKHETVVIAPKDAEPRNCCCHLKVAPERKEVPAMLPVEIGVATLPTVAVALTLPQTITVAIVAPDTTKENAPRGPPRVLYSPRGPPFS